MKRYKKVFYRGNSPWVKYLLNNISKHFSEYHFSRSISYASYIKDIKIENNKIIGEYINKNNENSVFSEIRFPKMKEKELIEELFEKYPYLLKHFNNPSVQNGFIKGFTNNVNKVVPDWNDLFLDCSCGAFDYLAPCKHIIGLFIYLFDYLDKNPEILLSVQGIDIKNKLNSVEKISFISDYISQNEILENGIINYSKNNDKNINVIENIINNETEVESLIKTRIGQSRFKKNLLNNNTKCLLCEINIKELLIASHIKPWAESNDNERLDINNGLLLCPIHDKLFDLGFITFNEFGEIIISERISKSMYFELKISSEMKIFTNDRILDYLKWHKQNIFK